MTWFKVDDSFPQHRKLGQIAGERTLYPQVITVWLTAGCWCAKELTDGRIPKSMVRALVPFPPKRAAAYLVDAGIWIDEGDHYRFHDWLKYQPTRERVLRERERARERMAHARANRGGCSPEQNENLAQPRTRSRTRDEVSRPGTGSSGGYGGGGKTPISETPGADRVRQSDHDPEDVRALLRSVFPGVVPEAAE